MKKKAEVKKWSEAAKEMFKGNIAKLERMHPSTPDYSVIYIISTCCLTCPGMNIHRIIMT
jgi:ATP-dependent Lon protease